MSEKKKFVLRATPRIKFKDLWENYPKETVNHIDPSDSKEMHDNHCAINLSESFYKCGITLKSFKGVKCSRFVCPQKSSKRKAVHILRAAEFAEWLKTKPFSGCPKHESYTGTDFKEKLNNRKGIIYLEDYWQREAEKGTKRRTGDHIDLWDDGTLAGSGTFLSLLRITFGLSWEGWYSDHTLSKKVLFWEIK